MVYKIFSKILTDKLKEVLSTIISRQKNAFIKGRTIGDNIMLKQEIVRGYHKNGGKPRMVVKVDIQKAYDTIC